MVLFYDLKMKTPVERTGSVLVLDIGLGSPHNGSATQM
jgi:hypothetical protein